MKPFKNNIGFDLGPSKLRFYKGGKKSIDEPAEYKKYMIIDQI